MGGRPGKLTLKSNQVCDSVVVISVPSSDSAEQFEQDSVTSRESFRRFSIARKFEIVDGDEAKFVETHLTSEQNTVISELERARDIVTDVTTGGA